MSLDRRSPLPYHVQIREQVRHLIAEGRLDSIQLTDTWLGQHLGVSRMTVRNALASLVRDGLIRRERGRGTFVVMEPPTDVFTFDTYVDQWQVRGRDVHERILVREYREAGVLLAALMAVPVGTPVGHFRRLRFADDQPVCLDDRYVPVSIFERLEDSDLLLQPNPTWKVIQDKLQIRIGRIDTRIWAAAADEADAAELVVPVGFPVLERHLDFYDLNGRMIMTGPSRFRSDRFVYRATIRS